MEAAVVLTRLAAFAAGTGLFGTPLFVLYALPARQPAPAWLKPLLAAAALMGVVAAVSALVLQVGLMAGDPAAGLNPGTLRDVLIGEGFGRSIVVRLSSGLIGLSLLAIAKSGRVLWSATAALGGLAMAALAWGGHGAADEGAAGLVHAGADVVHLLAAGLWLGALLMFLVLLIARSGDPLRFATLQVALERFSGVGSVVVAAIVASGLVNSWFLIGSQHVGEIATSLWGQLLLVKLALFAAMVGYAALNRYCLTPRLRMALADDPAAALTALRRSVTVESAAGLAVLALVAVLGVLAPPASS